MPTLSSDRLLVIENLDPEGPNQAADVARIFRCDQWIVARAGEIRMTAKTTHGVEIDCLGQSMEMIDFYQAMTARWPVVMRVRAPNYPLHPGLHDEVEAEFPCDRYDYVLSMGDECGLTGYFYERLQPSALARLGPRKRQVMAQEYFNLTGTEGAGRHWLSRDLHRYYYVDQFETLFDSPRAMAVNLIGTCNYTCLKCQYHSSDLTRKHDYPGAMPLEKYAIILDKVKEFRRLKTILPTITGEPLLHPHIVEIVRMTKAAGYGIGFATNGSLLTPELGERLLDAGVDGLAFSIDTADPVKYRALQAGGDLAGVEANLLAYRDLCLKKQGSFSATVACVVGPDNDGERDAFRTKWLGHGFHVQFFTLHDVFNNYKPFFSQPDWSPSFRSPCWAMWQNLYMTEEGRLVGCGISAKTSGFKESIFHMSAPELWRCKTLETLRRQQLNDEHPSYCHEASCWAGLLGTWSADDEGAVTLKSRCATHYSS
jgi:pyruvate-formate lyase-activating enzyme